MSFTRNGKRGGRPDRPSRVSPPKIRLMAEGETDERPSALRRGLPLQPSKPTDSIVAAENTAKYYDSVGIKETEETHLIPRKSLTEKLCLGLFPQRTETELVKTRQRDKVSGDMVEVANPKVVWRSDRTLLRKGDPTKIATDIYRKTSHSKVTKWDSQTEMGKLKTESIGKDKEMSMVPVVIEESTENLVDVYFPESK